LVYSFLNANKLFDSFPDNPAIWIISSSVGAFCSIRYLVFTSFVVEEKSEMILSRAGEDEDMAATEEVHRVHVDT